jgi:hypothetical protein
MMPICPFCHREMIEFLRAESGAAWECNDCRTTLIRVTATPAPRIAPKLMTAISEIQLPTSATPRSEDVNATPQTDSAPPSEKGSG